MDRGRKDAGRRALRHGGTVVAAFVVLGFAVGCDDRSEIPPPAAETVAKPVPPELQRPTTQQLVAGPRKSLPLFVFPLILQVPDLPKASIKSPQWLVSSAGGEGSPSQWIEGPGPSGDVMIQMARLPDTYTLATIQGMENAARKEVAAKPDTSLYLNMRSIGPIRVIEQRTLRHLPAQDAALPKSGSATGELIVTHVPASDDVDWSLRIFTPSGKQFASGTLTFVGLPKEQYDKDKAFLEQLIGSLHYDGAGGELP